MKLDLNKPYDLKRFKVYVNKLAEKKAKVEIKELKPKRTLKQNAYLHVLISLCAIEWGYTLDEMKTSLKRSCSFMIYERNGEKFLKQTRTMKTDELAEFIEWIRNYAGRNGLYLPTAEEYLNNQHEIDREIDANRSYL